MADDLAKVEQIELTSSPYSIDLEVYRGEEGKRGAYIIPGSGNPSEYFDVTTQTYTFPDPTGAEEELVAQLYDWYIDLDTTSTTYLSTFQLKKTNVWEQIFKVIPNVYNTNRMLNFVNGNATTNVIVPKETLLLSQKFGQNFNLASLVVNLDVDIENPPPGLPYPVMSSAIAGTPTFDGTNYTFPITINASQVMPGTNLVTNPSMESVSTGTVVMRRNLVTNPSFEVDTTGWSAISSTTISRVTTQSYVGIASLQSVATATNAATGLNDITVAGSSTYTFSAWVKGEAGKTIFLALRELTSASAEIGRTNTSEFVMTGDWQRVTVTRSFGATGVKASAFVRNGTVSAAHTFYIDAAMLEASSVAGDYFDGSTTDALGWDYAWSGTANASISTAACAATTVRTNLSENPQMATGTYPGSNNSTTNPIVKNSAVPATHPLGITTCLMSSSTGTNANLLSIYGADGRINTGSVQRTMGVYVYVNEAGYQVTAFGGWSATPLTANTWTWVQQTTATAAGVWAEIAVTKITGNASTTARAYVTGLIAEAGTVAPANYFDGSFSPAGDFSFAWTGTANASTSIQRGATVASYAPSSVGSVASREWTLTGNQSLRVIPTSTSNNDTFVSLGGDAGAFRLGMSVGNTYTVSGTIRLAAAQTGTLNARARRIAFFYKNSAGTYVEAQSAQAPNSAGATRLSVTVSIPTGATEAFIRLYNGALVGGGDVWWDNVLVVEGNYTGEYFDINPYPINSPRTAHISISVI